MSVIQPSPIFTVNGTAFTAPNYVRAVTQDTTVSLALASVLGITSVQWRVVGSNDPDVALPEITRTGYPLGVTASFEMPDLAGIAFKIECKINGGKDVFQVTQSGYTFSAIIGVESAGEFLPFAFGETGERSQYGYLPLMNERLGVGPSSFDGDASNIPFDDTGLTHFIGANVQAAAAAADAAITAAASGGLAAPANPADDGKVAIASGGNLTYATVAAANIASNAVETAKINDLAVTAGKLAANAVETAKINDLAVTAGKLAANSVETAKVNDLAITSGKIADSAVVTAKINNLAVTTGKIADEAITDPKIAPIGTRWTIDEVEGSEPTYSGTLRAATAVPLSDGAESIVAAGSSHIQFLASSGFWEDNSEGAVIYHSITAGDGAVVIVGNSAAILSAESAEGTLTSRTADDSYTGNFFSSAWGNGVFVIGGADGELQSSPDGTTWTHRDNDGSLTGSVLALTYGGGLFFAAIGSTIQTSADGATWSDESVSIGTVQGLAYHDGTLIAVGNSGNIQASTDDGASFSTVSPDASYTGTFRSVRWCYDRFVAVGDSGEVQYSFTGLSGWTHVDIASGYSGNLYDVVFARGKLWVFGENADAGGIQVSDFELDGGKVRHGTIGREHLAANAYLLPIRHAAGSTEIRATDNGVHVIITSGSAADFTVNDNLPIGGVVYVTRGGTGSVTLDPSVTLRVAASKGLQIAEQWETVMIQKIGVGECLATGRLVAP